MGKKKKSHKKEHKKKKHRSRTDSETSTSSSSSKRSNSGSDRDNKKKEETRKQEVNMAFDKSKDYDKMSLVSWHLSQKSETLMFDDQPNEDKNANETFVWRKKNAKIGLDKFDPKDLLLLNKAKKEETQRELEKLEKRKIIREREKEERDREREFAQREKESEYHKEWEKQEDSFQLKQVKLRSKIRIDEGRAKPIDLLAKYISAEDDSLGLGIEMHEPYTYLNGLTIRDLEDLLADIEIYSTYEQGANADYWRDITIVTEDELKKLQLIDKNSREHVGDRREGINQSVLQDVTSFLKGKSYNELIALEESIKKKINEETGIDIGYWESLLSQLKAHMARARLKERHQKVLAQKLEVLKRQQGIVKSDETKSSTSSSSKASRKEEEKLKEKEMKEKAKEEKYKNKDEINIDDDEEEEDDFDRQEKAEEQEETLELDQLTLAVREYESGRYSPPLLRASDLSADTFMLTQEDYDSQLAAKRAQVLGTGAIRPDVEDEFEALARENMGELPESSEAGGEAGGAAKKDSTGGQSGGGGGAQEVNLDHHYNWSDKYRPRKPRYYNRVHTGYDWNQYNKKHYDVDNPPPKTVQGYKFNIFYPDLIDKTQTPRYSIKTCQDNRDFAILRFHAGPPYEDVAFKIVSREWDISYRHGFRNQFQNGIYQLWFHFRKWKYRR